MFQKYFLQVDIHLEIRLVKPSSEAVRYAVFRNGAFSPIGNKSFLLSLHLILLAISPYLATLDLLVIKKNLYSFCYSYVWTLRRTVIVVVVVSDLEDCGIAKKNVCVLF